jgi:AraC family transcriptional regulator
MSRAATAPRPGNLAAGQFYGATAARRSEGGLVLSELRHTQPRLLPLHDHQCPGFYVLLGGAYREWLGPRPLDYRRRSAVFHPAAFRHRDRIGDGGAHLFAVELSGTLLARVEALLPRSPVVDTDGLLASLACRLRDEMGAEDPAASLVREGLACELVGALHRRAAAEAARPRWLLRADEALRGELERRWSLADLAGTAEVHPARLARGFRRGFGESVGERLRRLRLEAARAALERPGTDLAEVALACGFADQSHLTRAFRAAFGLTPGAYRRRRSAVS